MNLKTYLLLFVMTVSVYCHAQYSLVHETLLTDHIPASENINDIKFAIRGDTLCQLRVLTSKNGDLFKLTMYSMSSGKEISCDTLDGLPKFLVKQFDFTADHILLTGSDKYILVNLKKAELDISIVQTYIPKPYKENPPYRNCHFLNDSIALFSIIYNYDPLSRNPGLYMSLFNVRTKKFVKQYFSEFPGIVESHLGYNNLTVSNDRIYIATPLGGEIWEFDFTLKLIQKTQTQVFTTDQLSKNLKFVSNSDSLVRHNNKYIDSIIAVTDRDSLARIHSIGLFDKNYIVRIIDSFSTWHSFVTNIYVLQNNYLGVCVSRPEYFENNVDFYIVDAKTGKTIKEYKKWVCRIPLQINKVEDLLSVNLNVGSGIMPYFYNGKIYIGNTLSKDYFEKGNSETLMEKISKKQIKNGYKWYLLEYTY